MDVEGEAIRGSVTTVISPIHSRPLARLVFRGGRCLRLAYTPGGVPVNILGAGRDLPKDRG